MHLRLHKKKLHDVCTAMPLLDWATAKEVAIMRAEAARAEAELAAAGEPPMAPGGYLEALLA